jgi:hypothetical protein
LRAYVEAGGVVLVDPTGGMNAFDGEVREHLLPKAFPTEFPRLIDFGHPLLGGGSIGMDDLSRPKVRPYVTERVGNGVGVVQLLTPSKPAGAKGTPGSVVITSLDLTSGLLGTNTWGVMGFEPNYAQSLVKNVITWALAGRPVEK